MEDDAEVFKPSTFKRAMPFNEWVVDRDCCSRSDRGKACSPSPVALLLASSVDETETAWGVNTAGVADIPVVESRDCDSWRPPAGVCSPTAIVAPACSS